MRVSNNIASRISNNGTNNTVTKQQGLTPASNTWLNAITNALSIDKTSRPSKYSDEPVFVDISQNARNSKYWNDESISFPTINTDIQGYKRDLTLEIKSQY